MDAPPNRHAHDADLGAFLELVNTLEYSDGQPVEHLPTPAAALGFFASRGLAHQESLAETAGDEEAGRERLERVRSVRAAAREVWDALVQHRAADPTAVERVNVALRNRPLVELTLRQDGCSVGHCHTGDPWDEALARTLEPFVEAVAAGEVDRFRICANDGCRWVFRDESRAGRRRWCDMASCGNRAKAARFRARRKGAEVA